MIMDEMEDRIWGHGIQSSQGEPSRRDEIICEPLPMDTLQSGRHMSRPSSPATNKKNPNFSRCFAINEILN
jgi:hypothetical protein